VRISALAKLASDSGAGVALEEAAGAAEATEGNEADGADVGAGFAGWTAAAPPHATMKSPRATNREREVITSSDIFRRFGG